MSNPNILDPPFSPISCRDTKITDGILFDRTQRNIENLFRKIDVGVMKEVYATTHGSWFAEPEFCGKYLDTAVQIYRTTGDESILKKAGDLVRSIVANQREDGYLGTYHKGLEFEETFGVWNQNFTIMGLLSYFEETGDRAALDCACRCADFLAGNFMRPDGPDLFSCVNQGIEHSCLIHQMPRLYSLTGKQLYLDFSRFLIEKMEGTAIKLVTIPLKSIVPMSAFGCCKAAEILLCYQGLLDLYRVTGTEDYLAAAARYWEIVNSTQIGITGNGSVFELWNYWGNKVVAPPMDVHPNENCVAVCWMKLGAKLFEWQGQTKYIDALECTLYNHLLGSQAHDGSDFSYYQALAGRKVHAKHPGQYSCCRYRGMSMLAHLPRYIFARRANELHVLLYGSAKTTVEIGSTRVGVEQTTDFPRSGKIKIRVAPAAEVSFPLKVRIPEWSSVEKVLLDGKPQKIREENHYAVVDRVWGKAGNTLSMELAMPTGFAEGKVGDTPSAACTYGPLVLSLDSRYGTPIEETEILVEGEPPDLRREAVGDGDSGDGAAAGAAFTPMVRFTAKGRHRGKPRDITLVDYASAGSLKPDIDRFKVWIPTAGKER